MHYTWEFSYLFKKSSLTNQLTILSKLLVTILWSFWTVLGLFSANWNHWRFALGIFLCGVLSTGTCFLMICTWEDFQVWNGDRKEIGLPDCEYFCHVSSPRRSLGDQTISFWNIKFRTTPVTHASSSATRPYSAQGSAWFACPLHPSPHPLSQGRYPRSSSMNQGWSSD